MSLFASKALGESNGVDPCNFAALWDKSRAMLLSLLSFDHEGSILREDDVIDDDDDSFNDDYDDGMMMKNHDD